MNRENSDPGIQTVGKIYRDMTIDTEWSVISERGFTWWGHRYAQRIWADEPFEDQGLLVSKVNAETDFLIYPDRSAETEQLLAVGMRYASLSGPVIYQHPGCIKLRCSAFVHEENQGWLASLLGLAAIMGYCDVAFKAEELAPLLGLEPDRSEHPCSGPRDEMDEMLNVIDSLVIPEGKKPLSKINGEELQRMADGLNDRGLFSTASDKGLTAYYNVYSKISDKAVSVLCEHHLF